MAIGEKLMRLSETGLYETLSSLAAVSRTEDLVSWSKGELQSVLPHGAFIGGLGKIAPMGIRPWLLISANFPADYLSFIRSRDKQFVTPTLRSWLQTGEPQINTVSNNQGDSSDAWLSALSASGLRNIASHGVFDSSHQFASYFSFHQIPVPLLGDPQKQLLKLIVPGMHAAMLRIHGREILEKYALPHLMGRDTLSPREREILQWVCKGKTNYEIAVILGISYKTVKNHVQSILIKLRVNNRAQAAAKAIELKLCEAEELIAGEN